MLAVNKTALVSAALTAASLLQVGVKDPVLTFGGDPETIKRLNALPEYPNTTQLFEALNIPVQAKEQLLDTVAEGNISIQTATKAFETIERHRKLAEEARIVAEERARREREQDELRGKARGEEASYSSLANEITQGELGSAIRTVVRMLRSRGVDVSAPLS